jgi:hypothetical protein
MKELKTLGIVESMRKGSYNHLAIKAAQELVPDGAVLNLIELHGIATTNFAEIHDSLKLLSRKNNGTYLNCQFRIRMMQCPGVIPHLSRPSTRFSN